MAAVQRRIGDGLAVLGGARPDVLEAAPGARPRFVALGGVLLSTGGLAVVSMAFAVAMALGVWWPLALLVGLGWGAVVVNLDRMLLVGMAHDASLRRNLVLAVPRIGLALILGAVIATPLTLQVFSAEIDTEVKAMQAEDADAFRETLETDARFTGLPQLREDVALGESIVASGGAADPQLASVQGDATAAQQAYDAALETQRGLEARAQCELDGTCGTGDAGTGQAYVEARAAADAQEGVVAAARSALDASTAAASAAEGRAAGLAAASLETDRAELARLTAEQIRLQTAFDATNEDADGILARLEALDRLGDRNLTLAAAQVMLSLLFMSIEILPVLMKLLLNFGPRSAYDELAALRDSGDVEIEAMQRDSRLAVAAAREELLVMAERERIDRQKSAILARREAAEAAARIERAAAVRAAERAAAMAQAPAEVAPEGLRPWDTGPMRLARMLGSGRRRPADRVPTGV
ncbi:DUF4407 domain-containing protein [Geodermatophilus sp. DSM 44513]|uniref:DUF4407 domain-containing protein n=1 Tax=Geodermatophilus sp. DSM 44513 TaxID=1528104 RepID=UPI001276D459|nr:DUF4407 domain-containing protein [Geodermatophilus sp. DSM 44513]WNV74140.1 DUF4407 domain-containing protein [Geodermatophilus sp. DSM 44513]